jgi:hypothetical protein
MLLKKKSLSLTSTLIITGSIFFAACSNDNPKEENIAAADSVVATVETQDVKYVLPSPLQIASIFKKSGLKYKDGVISKATDPSKYTTTLSKALNLGVYSADLSYTVLNKQTQEALTYMKLSHQLADNLGIGSVFEQGNLSKRFEKNLTNEDSLAYIIAELQMVTDMYLDENDQHHITPIVFSGAWIESMHIGANVYDKGKDKSFNSKLAEQMTILGSIINALKAEEKKEPTISTLTADLQSIKDIYDSLPSIKAMNSEDTKKELTLTDAEVEQLTKKIEELRTKFING